MQDRDLFVERGQDRDLGAHQDGIGRAHCSRLAQVLGAQGVALVEEGEKIRRSGDRDQILVFGPVDLVAAEAALRESLTVVASDWSHLESLEGAAARLGASAVRIHLEFNTGMNRLGFQPTEAAKLEEWVRSKREFILDGVCTHLLRGNDAGEPGGESEQQLRRFARAGYCNPCGRRHAEYPPGSLNAAELNRSGRALPSPSATRADRSANIRPGRSRRHSATAPQSSSPSRNVLLRWCRFRRVWHPNPAA